MMYDLEVTIAELASLEPKVARAANVSRNEAFEQAVVDTVRSTTEESSELRQQASGASAAMRAMLGQTSRSCRRGRAIGNGNERCCRRPRPA